MIDDRMIAPGGAHPVTITEAGRRWRVKFGDHVIADSEDVMILKEGTMAPVVYFPRAEVSTEYMSDSDTRSHCPLKGDASYLTLVMDGEIIEDIAWSYRDPYPAAAAIADRLAFYPDKVEIYTVDDAAVNPRHQDRPSIDDVVRHTDSGGGRSQA